MNLFRITLPRMAFLVAGLLGTPQLARADLRIYLQEDNGAIVQVASGTSFTNASFSGTFNDFRVDVLGGSSVNGTTLSSLLSSTTSVTNLSGTQHTLHLYVTQDGYSLPSGSPLRVESGLGGSVNNPSLTLSNIFQAYADRNNNLLGMTDFTNGPQSASQSGSTFDTGSAFGLFFRTGLYSLTSVANFQLSGGANANYSAHVNLAATPAPAGIVLALSSVPCFVGAWLRRRKANLNG